MFFGHSEQIKPGKESNKLKIKLNYYTNIRYSFYIYND